VIAGWLQTLSRKFYQALVREDTVDPADLIFVIAGRMERKDYGIELFRAGVAPRLVLSIGRFEVSKMRKLAVDGIEELVRLRDQTPPDDRHFFIVMERSAPGLRPDSPPTRETRIEQVPLARWSTYGEALAMRSFLERGTARRVIIVSTDVHLRRVSLVLSQIFAGRDIQFRYCPVPTRLTSLSKHDWWARSDHRRFVIKEMMKLVGYRIILWMPQLAINRLMRLK